MIDTSPPGYTFVFDVSGIKFSDADVMVRVRNPFGNGYLTFNAGAPKDLQELCINLTRLEFGWWYITENDKLGYSGFQEIISITQPIQSKSMKPKMPKFLIIAFVLFLLGVLMLLFSLSQMDHL